MRMNEKECNMEHATMQRYAIHREDGGQNNSGSEYQFKRTVLTVMFEFEIN